MRSKANFIHSVAAMVVTMAMALGMAACQSDDFFEGHGAQTANGVTELRFVSDPMDVCNVKTRASDPKEDAEKAIHDINIFFFNSEGQYLTGGYLTGYPDAPEQGGYYKTGDGVTMIKIDDGNIDNANGHPITIYAVANVGTLFDNMEKENERPVLTDPDDPNKTPRQVLEEMVYQPYREGQVSVGLPGTGMPMIGHADISVGTGNAPVIELKALMARVDVNLEIDSEHGDDQLPWFMLTDYTVKNAPRQVAFSEPDANEQTGEGWTDWTQEVNVQQPTITFHNREEMKNVCTFYVFENMQNPEYKVDEGERWASGEGIGTEYSETTYAAALYPDGIEEGHKQRYKPYLANQNATAVELHGFYHTYNDANSTNSTYEVRYTLYLGSNHTDNFQLVRNHQYKNNITVKGLLAQNSTTGEYTFDARVDIEQDDNDFYVAILRERDHDAHFCVTPMDVYMFNDDNTHDNVMMDVYLGEVDDAGNVIESTIPTWIRMERIDADDMANGTVSYSGVDEVATGTPWTAGNGKRKYFTTTLLDELEDNGKHVTLKKSRDRVYFYIDENLSDSESRQATVTLIYKEKQTDGTWKEAGRKTIILGQLPFLRVQVYGRDDNANSAYPDNQYGDGVIYMEQIEEYLNHYDPLDKYSTEQIYEGLPWSNEGVNISWGNDQKRQYDFSGRHLLQPSNTGMYDAWENYVLGMDYTVDIINKTGTFEMDLNGIPNTAAEYCWNRNKRQADGSVNQDNAKYFLPGIRQMEDALRTYYNQFSEFQGNYYWSSAPAATNYGILGDSENSTHARATKVDANGNYIESKYQGDEGFKSRTDVLRIRAFRSDLNPQE